MIVLSKFTRVQSRTAPESLRTCPCIVPPIARLTVSLEIMRQHATKFNVAVILAHTVVLGIRIERQVSLVGIRSIVVYHSRPASTSIPEVLAPRTWAWNLTKAIGSPMS